MMYVIAFVFGVIAGTALQHYTDLASWVAAKFEELYRIPWKK